MDIKQGERRRTRSAPKTGASIEELQRDVSSDPVYSLHRDFGFLIQDVARLLRTRIDLRARKVSLTQAQWRVAAHLIREPGLTQSDLASILEMRKTALGPVLRRMEQQGWIVRCADPADRRVWRLYATDTIAPVFRRVRDESRDMYDSVLADLSEGQKQPLVRLLDRVKATLMTDAG